MRIQFKNYLCLLTLFSAGFINSATAQRGGSRDRERGYPANSNNNSRVVVQQGGSPRQASVSHQGNADLNHHRRQPSFDRQAPVLSGRENSSIRSREQLSQHSTNRGNVIRQTDNGAQINNNVNRRIDNNINRRVDNNVNRQIDNNVNRRIDNNVNRQIDNNVNRQTNRNIVHQRTTERVSVTRPSRVNNNSQTSTRARNSYSRSGYTTVRSNHYYAPRRYYYYGAPRYSILPRGCLSIRFGGYPYYYHSGLFYSHYQGFYQPVFAPIGIHINILPFGYYSFYHGLDRFYYYDGIYYRDYGANRYEVVDAPLGAVVSRLPKGATVAMINGEKFYEFNGTYYKEGTNSKNEVVYTVVGKYGEVNNTDETSRSSDPELRIGDVISELPEGSKQVTINGESLFVSPDNTYFKQQRNGNETSYEVIGKQMSDQ